MRASEQILRLYRDDRERLAETATWRPRRRRWRRSSIPSPRRRSSTIPDAIEDAVDDGDLAPLPVDPALGWEPDQDIGELADELDQRPSSTAPCARRRWRRSATWPGWCATNQRRRDAAAGDERGPRPRLPGPAGAVEPAGDRGVLAAHDRVVVRHPPRLRVASARREAFQYALDRLRALALIDYAVEPGAIHVTVSKLGGELLDP